MKKIIFLTIGLFAITFGHSQHIFTPNIPAQEFYDTVQVDKLVRQINGAGVILGDSGIAATAILELKSTTKGLLIPRLNTTQMNAISSPAPWLTIINTDSGKICLYNSGWKCIGLVGNTGPTGAQGITGATGVTGSTGASGINGIDGTNGSNGTNGATGATGPTGITGPSGIDGATGADGITGPSGMDGVTGPSGVDGVTGIDGATGPTGAIGADGANCITWQFEDGTGPGGGQWTIGFTPQQITISINDFNSVDETNWLDAIHTNTTISITQGNNHSIFTIDSITSVSVSGSIYIFSFAIITSHGSFTSGENCCISYVNNGLAGATGPTGESGISNDSILWSSGNGNLYPTNLSLNVGIGTTSPFAKTEIDISDTTFNAFTIRNIYGRFIDVEQGMVPTISMGDVSIGQNQTELTIDDLNTTIDLESPFGNVLMQTGTGNVGIGTVSPTAKLEVDTSFRYVDGNQGAGKVLTSDASGNADWVDVNSIFWATTGNSGTNPATNFIGTNDGAPLIFKSSSGISGFLQPNNVSFGVNSGNYPNATGNGTTNLGTNSLPLLTTGNANTAVGLQTMTALTSGNGNTAIGANAGAFIEEGDSFNTVIGEEANTGGGVSNSTAIGAKAEVDISDAVVIGAIAGVNQATTTVKVGIGTTTPNATLTVIKSDTLGDLLYVASPAGGILYINNGANPDVSIGDVDCALNCQRVNFSYATETFDNSLDSSIFRGTYNTFAGQVGIGTTAPGSKLEVAGSALLSDTVYILGSISIGLNTTQPTTAFQLNDGTNAAGYVLTTDALGNANWQTNRGINTDSIINPSSTSLDTLDSNITGVIFIGGGLTSTYTLTLPANPYQGQRITINTSGGTTINTLSIDPNGKAIDVTDATTISVFFSTSLPTPAVLRFNNGKWTF